MNATLKARIVVIDDDPFVSSALTRFLRRSGHHCVTADDAPEGMDEVRSSVPDAVVLDIALPGGDGRDVLSALRRDPSLENVVFLVLSGEIDQYRRMQALTAGADEVLEKPFDPHMLERRLVHMVAKKRAAAKAG